MPKTVHFGEFLTSWSLRSNSITRQVNFELAKNVGKLLKNCRFWVFRLWHFPPIFVILKLTCLVTLFDHKLYIFSKSRQKRFLAFLMNSKCLRSSHCGMRLFLWFSYTVNRQKWRTNHGITILKKPDSDWWGG